MDWLVIDALEGDLARVELGDGRHVDVPRAWLPAGAREGDHVRVKVQDDGTVRFTVDEERTRDARDAAQRALDAITGEPPEDFHI